MSTEHSAPEGAEADLATVQEQLRAAMGRLYVSDRERIRYRDRTEVLEMRLEDRAKALRDIAQRAPMHGAQWAAETARAALKQGERE